VRKKVQTKNFKYLKGALIILFSMLTFRATAPDIKFAIILVSKPVDAYDIFIKAVIQVESSGDTLAYNVDEEAIGAFQIRPIRLLDYNQRTGKNYKKEDCYNFEISKEIFLYYAGKIGLQNYETIARKWNGSGVTTLDYWKKVKSYL
jgi:hypothetical protein